MARSMWHEEEYGEVDRDEIKRIGLICYRLWSLRLRTLPMVSDRGRNKYTYEIHCRCVLAHMAKGGFKRMPDGVMLIPSIPVLVSPIAQQKRMKTLTDSMRMLISGLETLPAVDFLFDI